MTETLIQRLRQVTIFYEGSIDGETIKEAANALEASERDRKALLETVMHHATQPEARFAALRTRISELENVLGAVTDELQEQIEGDYKYMYGDPVHPAMAGRLDRDLSTVREARAALRNRENRE